MTFGPFVYRLGRPGISLTDGGGPIRGELRSIRRRSTDFGCRSSAAGKTAQSEKGKEWAPQTRWLVYSRTDNTPPSEYLPARHRIGQGVDLSMAVWTRDVNTRPRSGDGHTLADQRETKVQFLPMLSIFAAASAQELGGGTNYGAPQVALPRGVRTPSNSCVGELVTGQGWPNGLPPRVPCAKSRRENHGTLRVTPTLEDQHKTREEVAVNTEGSGDAWGAGINL